MAEPFIIAHYAQESDENPQICYKTKNREDAETEFLNVAKKKCKSAVLYNTLTDEVMKIAIQGEPIFLVRAIELVRQEKGDSPLSAVTKKAQKAVASKAIGAIVKAFVGESVPGVGGVVLAHFTAPYYAIQGDGVGVASAAAGLWGGLSGAIIGTAVGGPVGAVVGGIAGGATASTAAGALVKMSHHKYQCNNCNGTGLVDDFRTCKICKGYGYHKH